MASTLTHLQSAARTRGRPDHGLTRLSARTGTLPHMDEFEAELWLWSAKEGDSWVFVTVPEDLSDEIRERSGPPRGFGSARVEVAIGATTWRTSVFPNSREPGCYALPVKKAVRRAERLEVGDTAVFGLRVLDA